MIVRKNRDTTSSEIMRWTGKIAAEESAVVMPRGTKVPSKVKGEFKKKFVRPCENLSVK